MHKNDYQKNLDNYYLWREMEEEGLGKGSQGLQLCNLLFLKLRGGTWMWKCFLLGILLYTWNCS